MRQDILAMEDEYYGRLHDKWDRAHEAEHRDIGYNPKEKRYALENLMDYLSGDIELLEDYAKSVSEEKRQVSRDYDGLLAVLRQYKELLTKDYEDADLEYQLDADYYDSLDR